MRRSPFAAAAAAGVLASLLAAVPSATADAATACAPNPKLTLATQKALPGGASLRVWNTTGKTMYGRPASTQVATVTARLGAHMTVQSAFTSVTGMHPTHTFASAPNVVAAINGDYFDYSRDYRDAIPYSAEIRNGVVVKATTVPTRVVGLGVDGKMHAGNLSMTGKVFSGKVSFPLNAVNTPDVSGLSMWTPAWGPAIRSRGAVEVTVKAGKVISKIRSRYSSVPAGQVVFAASPNSKAAAFLNGLKVGAPLTQQVVQNSDQGIGYSMAIGRGQIVLRNKAMTADCVSYNGHTTRPRTAIGWADGGSTVIFLTVNAGPGGPLYDGGFTYSQAAQALANAGATDGVLVDGGGSTTLEARTSLTRSPVRLDQRPSWERPVPNGFLLKVR